MKLENSLLDHQDETIHNVYRTAQPLNDRVVEASFESAVNIVRSALSYSLQFVGCYFPRSLVGLWQPSGEESAKQQEAQVGPLEPGVAKGAAHFPSPGSVAGE